MVVRGRSGLAAGFEGYQDSSGRSKWSHSRASDARSTSRPFYKGGGDPIVLAGCAPAKHRLAGAVLDATVQVAGANRVQQRELPLWLDEYGLPHYPPRRGGNRGTRIARL
jgi:hypothetical protein